MSDADSPVDSFDFEGHRRKAEEQYQAVRPRYAEYAQELANLLNRAFASRQIRVVTVQARAKDVNQFGIKAAKPSDDNPHLPKYPEPLTEIEDMAGIRIITYLLMDIETVERVVHDLFDVHDRSNKGEMLEHSDRFGYQSVHYIVSVTDERLKALELPQFSGMKAEIQIRTILQHAWAEIEHDIQYKPIDVLPHSIRRRFAALAGMLEIADREFQAIQNDDEQLRRDARQSVQEDRLDEVEITPDALKAYLDKMLGTDARMVQESYVWAAGMLRTMGFKDFRSVENCIAPYLGQDLSRVAWRAKQGQLMRFETLLLAAMGEAFIRLHPRHNEPVAVQSYRKALKRLEEAGIPIGIGLQHVNDVIAEA